MFDYMIVVNDNGELKTVVRDELPSDRIKDDLDRALNEVLDRRSAQAEGMINPIYLVEQRERKR